MKHAPKITILLVLLFLISQVFGLIIIDKSVDETATVETGNVTFTELPYELERPPVDQGLSWIYIVVAVLFGTIIVLLLIKFRKPRVWKMWYILSVIFTVSITISVFINPSIAIILGIAIALYKVYRPNVIVHNLSEILIYSGIALIFVPMMNLYSVLMLLFIISLYDMYAVWKSKHMIKLAKFQSQTNVFAGLSVPYTKTKIISKTTPSSKGPTATQAILGGGDMAFPLLFSGVILKTMGMNFALIVAFCSGIGLLYLLMKSEKGKFYPAMPYISAGCLLGYGVILLLNFLIL